MGIEQHGQSGGTVGADIGAVSAWDRETGDRNVVVAVIDTGIVPGYEVELGENLWRNQDEVPGNGLMTMGMGMWTMCKGSILPPDRRTCRTMCPDMVLRWPLKSARWGTTESR